MPIYTTLDAGNIDLSMFIDADAIRVGEAFARLHTFVRGDASLDVFTCDAGTFAGLKRAAARIAGMPRDKSATVRYVQRQKDGKNVWKRLAKNATVKQNDVTREATVHSYSSEVIRKAIETLRETNGVHIKKQATLDSDDRIVVALVREAVPA